MAADFTSIGLVANVRRRGFLAPGFSTNDILQYATEQLRNYIPAFLKGLREEYLIANLTLVLTGAVLPAPARAVGAALRTLKWKTSDGRLQPVARTEPERAGDFCTTGSCPQAYYFEGNNVVLLPPTSAGTVVLGYQQRPGQLVLPTDCGLITGINTGTKTLSFDSLPSRFASSLLFDLIPGNGANRASTGNNFAAIALDVSVDNVTSGPATMVLTNAVPTDLHVGDYVAVSEETPIPQVPIELHDLVAQATAMQIANATGSARKDSIAAALTMLEGQLTTILTPRNDGSARAVVNRSSIGWRRGL